MSEGRGTKVFIAASSGGERRVRTAVGLARRLADVGLRYRLRELQLLVFPAAMTFVPALVPGPAAQPAAVPPLVIALGITLIYVVSNAALSFALPWVDQHVPPVLAMMLATHYALWSASGAAWLESLPIAGGLVALYAALGVRLLRLTIPPARPSRSLGPHPAPRRLSLYLGGALLLTATGLLALLAARRVLA